MVIICTGNATDINYLNIDVEYEIWSLCLPADIRIAPNMQQLVPTSSKESGQRARNLAVARAALAASKVQQCDAEQQLLLDNTMHPL